MKQETSIYTVDYFIKKFESIPEDKWCVETRNDGDGRRCAHGWCDLRGEGCNNPEELGFSDVLFPLMEGLGGAGINNGYDKRYQQPTPKQRILAALYDIKKLQEAQEGKAEFPEPKIKTVYVSVPETVISQSKELITNEN